MKIHLSEKISYNSSGYLIIPFFETIYKQHNNSTYKMIEDNIENIVIDKKYKTIFDQIDIKFKNSMINIATITVAIPEFNNHTHTHVHNNVVNHNIQQTKKSKKSKKTKKNNNHSGMLDKSSNTLENGLMQIYLIKISGSDKKNYNDILEELRVNGHLIFNLLKSNYIKNINLIPIFGAARGSGIKIDMLKAILEGIMLSSYKFDKYKTIKALEKHDAKKVFYLENIFLIASGIKSLETELSRLEKIVSSVFLARDIINEPANDNRSERFIKTIKHFISKHNIPVEIEVWNINKLRKLGMGLILGVGKGSNPINAPSVLIIKYSSSHSSSHSKSKDEIPEWVLLGKGITFDTGGLDLKNSQDMLDMKSDLSGAAAVVAFLLGYAMCGGKKSIYAMCPFAENSISAGSIKPTDVLTAYDGRTVEIVDTDAEGRLVLADAIAYIVATWPTAHIMDLATLTGQAEDISGKAFSCVLSVNAERETNELIEKSLVINEALVKLPMLEKEISKLESNIADIKNVNYKSSADIIMSSLFMKQFIKPNTKWIHIDIAGPSFQIDEVIKYASPEASGVGVRLLFEYFSK